MARKQIEQYPTTSDQPTAPETETSQATTDAQGSAPELQASPTTHRAPSERKHLALAHLIERTAALILSVAREVTATLRTIYNGQIGGCTIAEEPHRPTISVAPLPVPVGKTRAPFAALDYSSKDKSGRTRTASGLAEGAILTLNTTTATKDADTLTDAVIAAGAMLAAGWPRQSNDTTGTLRAARGWAQHLHRACGIELDTSSSTGRLVLMGAAYTDAADRPQGAVRIDSILRERIKTQAAAILAETGALSLTTAAPAMRPSQLTLHCPRCTTRDAESGKIEQPPVGAMYRVPYAVLDIDPTSPTVADDTVARLLAWHCQACRLPGMAVAEFGVIDAEQRIQYQHPGLRDHAATYATINMDVATKAPRAENRIAALYWVVEHLIAEAESLTAKAAKTPTEQPAPTTDEQPDQQTAAA